MQERVKEILSQLKDQISNYIFGQESIIEEVLCCFLSQGHILITGAPGLAKTTLVRVIANFLSLDFGRIQFTPDLLPSDIIGTDILNVDPITSKREFSFSKGVIFTNLLLADEINRASPRTQSALLEAMQERTCTVSGKIYPIESPFMVFATQNPFESEGTYYLPEAELDRFLIHSLISYPDEVAEEMILKKYNEEKLFKEERRNKISKEDIGLLFEASKKINVNEVLIKAINELVRSTRVEDRLFNQEFKEYIIYGSSPRGGIGLLSASKSLALLEGSDDLRWKHIVRMAKPVLRHRIKLSAFAKRERVSEDDIIETLISDVEKRANSTLD